MEDDAIFWERLIDMPDTEAIDLLRDRRTKLVAERSELVSYAAGRHPNIKREAGQRLAEIDPSITKLNEEISKRCNRQNNASWRNAVRTVLGEDAYNACREWIMINGR